jgi:hypothetical protein
MVGPLPFLPEGGEDDACSGPRISVRRSCSLPLPQLPPREQSLADLLEDLPPDSPYWWWTDRVERLLVADEPQAKKNPRHEGGGWW